MRLDIVFDTVCPWCFIGKRRMQRALALRPDIRVEIRWRPFLLNPDMPAGGIDRGLYLERKFGSPYRIERVHGAARQAGREVGIAFDFDAIQRMPSSLDSHRLIRWASGGPAQARLVELIFDAFFLEGRDTGDRDVLCQIAAAAGLPASAVRAFLESDDGIAAIEADHARVRRWGISGVPCFVFDENYAVAGAQDPDLLARLIDITSETRLEAVSLA